MKKLSRFLLSAALAAALFCGGALAAQPLPGEPGWVEPSVTVQLNGETMTFPDAQPMLKNSRTFLPFRAVFEALGAEVGFDEPEIGTYVITGSRGGTTVTMTADSPVVTIEKDGVVTEMVMDVAPFIDDATDRTYVPVFFAADALDCDVGWDPYTYTAILVDTERLVESATADKTYTRLEQLARYSGQAQYRTGLWDVAVSGAGQATLFGAQLPVTVSGGGALSDGDKVSLELDMTLDMTQLLLLMEQLGAVSGDLTGDLDRDRVTALAQDGVRVTARGDLSTGATYLCLGGRLPLMSGAEPEVWYSLPLSSTLRRMGTPVDWLSASALEDALLAGDHMAMAKAVLKEAGLTDSETSYVRGAAAVEQLFAAFADDAFSEADGVLSAPWAFVGADGAQAGLELAMTVTGEQVTGCVLTVTETVPADAQAGTPALETTTLLTVPGDGTLTAVLTTEISPLMQEQMTYTLRYTPGNAVPDTVPPADAAVKPYEGLLPLSGQG